MRIKDFPTPRMPEWANTTRQHWIMNTISGHLTKDHKHCDDTFFRAEACVNASQWDHAEICFRQFCDALEQHFAMEEKILFEAFEHATGNTIGPTAVMRNEHQQIRAQAKLLHDALKQRNAEIVLGHFDTLNILMHQHNLKEESVLYVMADRLLSGQQDVIVNAMNELLQKH